MRRRRSCPRERLAAFCLSLCWLLTACRSVPELPPADFTQPGWSLRQGQAVWRSARGQADIAGELLLASRDDRAVLQFSKSPLPLVSVQTAGPRWEVEFVPQRRTFRGTGPAPARLSWVELTRALGGTAPVAPLVFESKSRGFTLENPATGESISGFLSP